MIHRIIDLCANNRFLVVLFTGMAVFAGIYSMRSVRLDAIPDLSDTQVIIYTRWDRSPDIMEDQVTYPIIRALLGAPKVKDIRGFSDFGYSYVYIIFEDGTDLYWARSRTLEYLNGILPRLPQGVQVELARDETAVGWIYEYALVDKTGRHDLGQLRALQDWFLRFELKSLPNVAEVASLGGMVRQFQVVPMPDRLRAYNLPLSRVLAALKGANQESGGSVLELGEAEYMVRATGYLKTLDDFRQIPLATSAAAGIPVRLGDVATVQLGPEMRRGIAELDGQGEVAGGVIVMRSGKNALETIEAVKAKLATLQKSLPAGVEIVPTYDRSALINRAVENLTHKLIEEFIVVAIVCLAFLFHLRSALVAIVSLPLGVLAAFLVMRYQGVNANIMSLGGIAIAVGAMIDAAVVMIENAHKHLEHWQAKHPGGSLAGQERWNVIGESAAEVGPALFFSLLIITLSFIPVFTLEAQEGRLFSPLAFTKTYAMAAAAGLSVTLVPVLMGYLIRGRIPSEQANPLSRWLIRAYRPVLARVLARPGTTVAIAALLLAASAWPVMRIGGEFMPPLDEGDLLYMPSALPGLSAGKAAQLLQQTDRLIKTVPEVATVFGKAGRADTATDPAPIEMFETTIRFRPRDQWRPGMTTDKIVEELDRIVKVPGLSNIWVPPIRNRIDMLATGIKSPVGIKVAGTDLKEIDRLASRIEAAVKTVPGVTSALAERLAGGRYIDVDIDRVAAARYGLNIEDVQSIVSSGVGGDNVGEVVDGLARFPISVRYPRDYRDSVEQLRGLPIVTDRGQQITLSDVARIQIVQGPPMLRSENARLSGWVYVDIRGRDLRSAVRDMQAAVAKAVPMPAGYSVSWSGQFEYLERATAKLKVVVPFTLLIIFVLLYLVFGRLDEALLIMGTLPLALIGGFWLLYLLGYNLSVAGVVGFIALAGVAAEFGVIMLLYLKQAWAGRMDQGEASLPALLDAIQEGAVLRVRPKAMTVAVILAGLIPIMWSHGTGSEVMQRIAAPMVGGMVTAPLLSLFVVPALYLLIRRRQAAAAPTSSVSSTPRPTHPSPQEETS